MMKGLDQRVESSENNSSNKEQCAFTVDGLYNSIYKNMRILGEESIFRDAVIDAF